MRVAGIVIYNPDIDILQKNINAIYDQVDKIVIYQNSLFDHSFLDELDKIEYINDGTNRGIALALNSIMEVAKSCGAQWCLLLDQDSVVDPGLVDGFENNTDLPKAAIITPVVIDEFSNSIAYSTEIIERIDMCITSGSYNSISAWEQLGGFRNEYFIDYVDWEYCARAHHNGYNVYRINNIHLNHRLGDRTNLSFLGHRFFTYNHSSFRKYYITRNTIVSYYLFPDESAFSHPYLRTMKRLLITLFYESDKVKKIESIIKGLFDSRKLYKSIKGKE